jgi:hypothetical protein
MSELRTDRDWHKMFPEQFDDATLLAHGSIAGWCYGKGETPPNLTAILKEAYEHAFATAFDAGYETALLTVRSA